MKEPMSIYGYEKLENELKDLIEVQRPNVVKEIDVAREQGDLKENAEYHAAREKQSFIEGRISEIKDILSRAVVIDPSSYIHDSVKFGSTVEIINCDDDSVNKYTLVGIPEANLEKGYISVSSPIAKSMLGKKEGDIFEVSLPRGKAEFEISSIEYIELKFD